VVEGSYVNSIAAGRRDVMTKKRTKVVIAVACVGALILIGLTIDLGRVHSARRRLERAVDDAALAGASELPLESAAFERALAYLSESGYDDLDREGVRIVTNAGDSTQTISGAPEAEAVLTIWMDTAFSRDWEAQEPSNTAYGMRVKVQKKVPTLFLRFVGIKQISIEDVAEAEVLSHILVAVISDVSGSTRFTVLCSGCWMEDCDYARCWTQRDKDAPKHCDEGSLFSRIALGDLGETEMSGPANMVEGMKRGIDVLSATTGACAQSRAGHIIMLISDRDPLALDAERAMQYAREARAQGIVVYTFSLGSDVEPDLMEKMAHTTGGHHFRAATPDELDEILDNFFYFRRENRLVR
jgi:hypothetical protein